MLRRIKISGYKSLIDVEISLGQLTVLFGPNAAGKSNFLDALQLLSRIATSRTLKDAFEPPYRGTPLESFTFGRQGIEGLLQQDSVSFTIEVDVELSPSVIEAVNRQAQEMRSIRPHEGNGKGPERPAVFVREHFLRYRITVEVLPRSGILRVANEYLAALTSHGEPRKGRNAFLEAVGERLHLRMEKQAHPSYYDRNLDHSLLSLPLYPPHYPHMVALRQELASWFFFYFEPRERMRAPSPVKEVRHIGLMGEDLAAFLNTLRTLDEPQFEAVERALRMFIPSLTGLDINLSPLGEVELRVLEGDTPVPARIMSEGTLRLLGLLALGGAKETPALVAFEEPENGVHPRRIQLIAELLQNYASRPSTQVIATTHSPVLLDHLSNESLLVCRKMGGQTEIVPFASYGKLWRTSEIEKALDTEELLPVSGRILRGDFDA